MASAERTTGAGGNPSFVIIGAMKAGTTTLYRWLCEHPEVRAAAVKEPNFFSRDANYRRGMKHYRAGFPVDAVSGDASVEYMDPDLATRVAARMRQALPSARLVAVLRDPVDRMISHYMHECQRARESRPFDHAIAEPGNVYIRRSLYNQGLAPFREHFAAEELLIVTTEELESQACWDRLLDHIGLSPEPRPTTRHNVGAGKGQFSTAMKWLWQSGLYRRAKRLPPGVRKLGKRLLIRDARRDTPPRSAVPNAVEDRLRVDAESLFESLGRPLPRWPTFS